MNRNEKAVLISLGIFALGLIILALLYGSAISGADSSSGTRGEEDNSYMDTATYIGSDSCMVCHGGEHTGWSDTLHSKMLQDPTPATVIGDFTLDPTLNDTAKGIPDVTIDLDYDPVSGEYSATMDGNRYVVVKTIGSQWKQRYTTQIGNSSYILPMQWNTETGVWVAYHLDDWYDTSGNPISIATSRSWDRRCGSCHTTGFSLTYNATTDEYIGSWSEDNIACEACHGPGSDHSGDPTRIWKSADSQVCGQCHGRGASLAVIGGRTLGYPWNDTSRVGTPHEGRYLPGDDLSQFIDLVDPINDTKRFWGDGSSQSHRQQYVDWLGTKHSTALPDLTALPYAQDFCLQCHSADYRLTPEDETPPTLQTAKWSLECATCHVAHNATIEHNLRMTETELCADCHAAGDVGPGEAVHHPHDEIIRGYINITGQSGTEWMLGGVTCTDCHMPDVAKSAISYDISSHTFKIITPETGIVHSMPNSCTVACHTDTTPGFTLTDEDANTTVTGWHSSFETEFSFAETTVLDAEQAIADAPDYGFDSTTIDEAQSEYDKAKFAFDYTEADGSHGAHNHNFQMSLLTYANDTAKSVIDMLTPGTIKGRIIDQLGDSVEAAEIKNESGVIFNTTDANGNFSFDYATGDKTFDVLWNGEKVGDFSGTIVSSQVTDVGDITVQLKGTVEGRIVDQDNNPVPDAEIQKDGTTYGTTDSNGEFSFDFGIGDHTFDIIVNGEKVGDFSATINPAQVTDVQDITVEIPEEAVDLAWLYILIAIIIIVIVIAVIAMTVRKKKPPIEEEAVPEVPEVEEETREE